MRRWRNVILALAALALGVVPAAFAQETTGTLSGTVVNPDGKPIAAASVTVSGPTGDRQVLTDESGRFLLAFLQPGTYKVTVSAEGHTPFTDDDVRVGLARTVRRYTLMPAMEEVVEVTAARPQVMDLSHTQTGSNISAELAEKIPLGRNVSSVLFLTPQVKGGGGTGAQNPSIAGSSGFENLYVFNGVNVTNAGYGALGSYSIVHGSQGQGINFNFVKETQVITGGFMPEYGQAMGGILNVISKSGGNEWDGSVFGYFTPAGLQADFKTPQLDVTPLGDIESIEDLDYGFDVGGPLVKDHFFIWLGLNPTRTEEKRHAPEGFPLAPDGPFLKRTDTLNWAAKLSVLPNQDHRIDISAFGDPSDTNLTYRNTAALRADNLQQFSSIDFGYENMAVEYQGSVTPEFTIKAAIANANNTFEEVFPEEFDLHRVADLTGLQLGTSSLVPISGGIGFYELFLESDNTQYRIHFKNLIGTHELGYGFGVEDIEYSSATDRTGPTLTLRDGRTTTTGAGVQRRIDRTLDPAGPNVTETEIDPTTGMPVAVIYRVTRAKLSPIGLTTDSKYKYGFVQDDWSITPNVHVQFGFRWEEQSINGTVTKYTFPSEWSPRVGVTWDHTGEGRSKLFGSWGRFYEKVPLDMAVRVFSPEVDVVRGEYYDAALTDPVTATGTRFTVVGGEASEVESGTRNSYTDEIVAGYERDLGKGWTIKGQYTYRDIGRALEDFATETGSAIAFGEADFGHYIIGNVPPSGYTFPPGVGFEPVTREYHALTIEASKTAPNWHVTTQYVLSKLHGNYEGLFRNDNDQSDPNLTSLYDFPNEDIFYFTFENGALNTDRAHRLQAFGYYEWDNLWTVGGRFLAQSGTPRNILASHPVYENDGEIALVRRGHAGRTPTTWQADVNFAKRWKLGGSFESHLGFKVDVTNLFNQRQATLFDYDNDNGVELDVCTINPMDSTCPDAAARYQRFLESIANGVPNPDFGRPVQFSAPREVRIGFTWTF